MSGNNVSMLDLGVGLNRNNTKYAAGKRWFDGNLVRWHNGMLEPIGGHVFLKQNDGNTIPVGTRPIRDVFSWRDLLKVPYVAYGSTDNVHINKVEGELADQVYVDVTPTDLQWQPSSNSGFGAGFYGKGLYGFTPAPPTNPDAEGQWSFDSWGRNLVGVHSQDGRLFQWDPQVGGKMTPVTNAPTDNTLVVSTQEEFLMVLGGKNNPARVQWCSRRNNTDWTPTETNSAGGFDLKTDGTIIAAHSMQGGVLVLTNTDVHMVEYVGPPNYYGRRLIAEHSGCVSKNSLAAIPRGIIWAGQDGFWVFDGAVTRLDCDVHHDVFDEARFDLPSRLFMGNNEEFSEIWFFFPTKTANEAGRYAMFNYGSMPHWTNGTMERTAWHAPVYSAKPISVSDRTPYQQEVGYTAAGESRIGQVYVETGAIELGEGDRNMRIDRITQDFGERPGGTLVNNDAYNFTLKLRQSPSSPIRVKGPISPNIAKGYTTTRTRSRQIFFRIDQTMDSYWTAGKVRLRVKPAGGR